MSLLDRIFKRPSLLDVKHEPQPIGPVLQATEDQLADERKILDGSAGAIDEKPVGIKHGTLAKFGGELRK